LHGQIVCYIEVIHEDFGLGKRVSTGNSDVASAERKEVPNNGQNGTDADWKNWITGTFNSVSHPIGTASMMKRSLGGVVDAHLLVYDTANLRVVDASILPLQISAHLQSTLYGVAEKAADLIKAAQSE